MTTAQRHSISLLANSAAISLFLMVVGVMYLISAGVCAADQFDTAKVAADTFTQAIDVASGKSVLWLALAGLCLTVIAIIALIVVMFRVISKGYQVLSDLTTAINSRPCAYGHINKK